MSNWDDSDYWGEDKWFDAYRLFIQSSPLTVLNQELQFQHKKDYWPDYGFNIDTKFPDLGYYDDVDKRAILTVIARSRKMAYHDWNCLHESTGSCNSLSNVEKLTINCVMCQITQLRELRLSHEESKCSHCGK